MEWNRCVWNWSRDEHNGIDMIWPRFEWNRNGKEKI